MHSGAELEREGYDMKVRMQFIINLYRKYGKPANQFWSSWSRRIFMRCSWRTSWCRKKI
jgi:hypothetical protein